jgi:hypothetical protein
MSENFQEVIIGLPKLHRFENKSVKAPLRIIMELQAVREGRYAESGLLLPQQRLVN